jgi:hypothetical protein
MSMITELVFWNETAKPSLDPKFSIAQAIAASAPISSTSAEISLGSTTRPLMVGRRFGRPLPLAPLLVAPGTSPSSA